MKTRRHAKILELINEHSVDTQEDLERVREMMRDDALRISYTK